MHPDTGLRRLGSFQDCWLSVRPTLHGRRWASNPLRLVYETSPRPNEERRHIRRRRESNTLRTVFAAPRLPTWLRRRVGACGRDRTDFQRIKNPPLILFSFTCTLLGSLESNQVLTGPKPVAVPDWLLPIKLARAVRVERTTSAPQTRPSDPLTYARTSLRRRESNSRCTAHEAVVLPLNRSAVVPGERLELPKRQRRV